MKSFIVVSVLVVLALVAQTSAQISAQPTFDCAGKSGYFADTYRQCHVFYYCYADGRKLTLSCSDNTTFNEQAGRCETNGPCVQYSA